MSSGVTKVHIYFTLPETSFSVPGIFPCVTIENIHFTVPENVLVVRSIIFSARILTSVWAIVRAKFDKSINNKNVFSYQSTPISMMKKISF